MLEEGDMGMSGNEVITMKKFLFFVFFLKIRRPPRSTQSGSSAASDVYKRQDRHFAEHPDWFEMDPQGVRHPDKSMCVSNPGLHLSLIHISEPTRPY